MAMATVPLRRPAGLEPEFAAGARWNYSNTGYVLLGTIIRRVSGRFYGDILGERVFAPLGMETARVISEADIVPNRAAGYRLVEGELKNQEWVSPESNTGADGALYFTALDLIAWDRGLRAGAILSPESWAQVFEPVKLRSGKPYPYGFGWNVLEFADQKVQRHGGSWQGFKADLVRYLGDELTIAVLANLAEAEAGADQRRHRGDLESQASQDGARADPGSRAAGHCAARERARSMRGRFATMKTLIHDYQNRPGEHCGSASTTDDPAAQRAGVSAACT
jgi:CubicO group peptidase (beta-lactamase class C family)